MRRKTLIGISSITIILMIGLLLMNKSGTSGLRGDTPVDPLRIKNYMQEQVDLGYRIPGTEGSLAFQTWIDQKIAGFDLWEIETQNFTYRGVELRNYWITSTNKIDGSFPKYIIGAHYDSRAVASQENPDFPVVGANDGASGVAGILELLHLIPKNLAMDFGFVLFDAEDQGYDGKAGGIIDDTGSTWSWIVGSTQFVADMSASQINQTQAFILFDMIADDDFLLKKEGRSDRELTNTFWSIAADLGYGDVFVDQPGVTLTDDHVPFINAGIPSIDIIDFDYPEWHTLRDTMANVDPESVAIVVDVTYQWILNMGGQTTISTSVTQENPSTSSKSLTTSETSTNTSTSEDTSVNLQLIPIFVTVIYIFKKRIGYKKI